MKILLPAARSVSFMLLTALLGACCSSPGSAGDVCRQTRHEGSGMKPYVETALGFRLCLPQPLTRTGATAGRVVFTGFGVPPGTTLRSKSLIVVPGTDADVQGGTAFGHFMAGGVTFRRTKLDEGSAGHSTLHITYIWTTAGGQKIFLDFTHYAVNPLVYDPADRPTNYDQAEQIKLTEKIMSTFTRLQ